MKIVMILRLLMSGISKFLLIFGSIIMYRGIVKDKIKKYIILGICFWLISLFIYIVVFFNK